MAQYTPSPWKVFNAWNNRDLISFTRIGNNENTVIQSEDTNDDLQATQSDLNLICAAPELLEFIKKFTKTPEKCTLMDALLLIDKVEGK